MDTAGGSVRRIERVPGAGGNVDYHVDVHADGISKRLVFSGNIFVGPVVLTGTDERGGRWDEVIDEPRRYGEFATADWISRFLDRRP